MSRQAIDRPPTARHPRGERGAATVEFAMVLPILLALLLGVVEIGQGWDAKLTLTQAVRQGARTAALGGTEAEARSAVASAADDLSASRLSITAPDGPCTEPSTVTVRATYRYTFEVPLLPAHDITFSSTSAMRCGG